MMKNLVLDVVNSMPENATIEEILEAIIVKLSVVKGLNDVENEDVSSSEEILQELATWKFIGQIFPKII